MAAKDRARAKAFERTVARILGGRRRLAGQGGGQDVDDTPFAVECKAWEKLQLREDWVEQALRHEAQEGRPWIIVQRPKGSRRIYATMDLKTVVWLCQGAGLLPLDATPTREEPDAEA